MNVERVKTGIAKLDEVLCGGFPRGGITLVAGGPGTGKTILAAQYLYNGAVKFNERGMYVSFEESAETFKEYMLTLGFDFDKLEKDGKVRILDTATMSSEALESTLNFIFDRVRALGAKRLVIDSITALTVASQKAIDVRVLVSLLQKLLRKEGCTTILITETPWGRNGIGTGVEEFIADGIILLETFSDGIEFKRRLSILKMRATSHDMRYYRYNIVEGEGFRILSYPDTRT